MNDENATSEAATVQTLQTVPCLFFVKLDGLECFHGRPGRPPQPQELPEGFVKPNQYTISFAHET
jgi:hypothetical protein